MYLANGAQFLNVTFYWHHLQVAVFGIVIVPLTCMYTSL